MFVEAVYKSLGGGKARPAPALRRRQRRVRREGASRAAAGIAAIGLAIAWVSGALLAQQAQPPAVPPTPRAQSPVDLTGQWVSLVTDDWRWRMVTPPKGDVLYLPVNEAGRKMAAHWDPARDAASGEACRAYGAGGILHLPGRLRISWQDDTTLKLETDTGQQTRLFNFGNAGAAAGRGHVPGLLARGVGTAGRRRGTRPRTWRRRGPRPGASMRVDHDTHEAGLSTAATACRMGRMPR